MRGFGGRTLLQMGRFLGQYFSWREKYSPKGRHVWTLCFAPKNPSATVVPASSLHFPNSVNHFLLGISSPVFASAGLDSPFGVSKHVSFPGFSPVATLRYICAGGRCVLGECLSNRPPVLFFGCIHPIDPFFLSLFFSALSAPLGCQPQHDTLGLTIGPMEAL